MVVGAGGLVVVFVGVVVFYELVEVFPLIIDVPLERMALVDWGEREVEGF